MYLKDSSFLDLSLNLEVNTWNTVGQKGSKGSKTWHMLRKFRVYVFKHLVRFQSINAKGKSFDNQRCVSAVHTARSDEGFSSLIISIRADVFLKADVLESWWRTHTSLVHFNIKRTSLIVKRHVLLNWKSTTAPSGTQWITDTVL